MTKPIIVGIDPGTTTGLSIIDLNKRILLVTSRKNFSAAKIKNQIMEYGKPVIISTDRLKVPGTVEKIASAFGSKIFRPKHDLSLDEKKSILKEPVKNPHERDSLSAALFAYKAYERKFKHIEKVLDSKSLKEYKDVVKELLIQKEIRNVSEAVELLKPRRKAPIIQITKEIHLDWRGEAQKKDRNFRDEKRRNEILKIYCEKLEERLIALERQKQNYLEEEMKKNEKVRKAIIREKEIESRDILIRQLKFEIAKQKELLTVYEEKIRIEQEEKGIIMENLVPVVIIPGFSKEEILEADRKFGVFNKVLFFEDQKFTKRVSKIFENIAPKIIIGEMDEDLRHYMKKHDIMVIEKLDIERRDFFGAASPDKIKDSIKKIEKNDFVNWLEDYRKR